jgi:hypothetical protein
MKKCWLAALILLFGSLAYGRVTGTTRISEINATAGGTFVQFNTGLNMGADDEGYDLKIFGATAGDYALFDVSGDELLMVDFDIDFDDAGNLVFGSDKDWLIESDTAKTLELIPATTDESSSINVGADTAGADLKLFAATTGEYLLWDASGDDLIGNYDTSLFTQTGAAANQFKVDATGTVAGYAIVFETTDGGVQINADGAANGDISVDAADDLTLTTGGDLILATTGTFNMAGALIANNRITTEVVAGTSDTLTAAQSGSTLIYTQTGGACTVTLPEATAATVGVWFVLVDANPAAASDLTVDPEGDGTINGDAAGNYIKC